MTFDNVVKIYDILIKDMTNIIENQLKNHKITCNYSFKKFIS